MYSNVLKFFIRRNVIHFLMNAPGTQTAHQRDAFQVAHAPQTPVSVIPVQMVVGEAVTAQEKTVFALLTHIPVSATLFIYVIQPAATGLHRIHSITVLLAATIRAQIVLLRNIASISVPRHTVQMTQAMMKLTVGIVNRNITS